MSGLHSPILIGVDGGGSGCRFALIVNGRRTEVRGPAANASSDLQGAVETLRQGLEGLRARAGLELDQIASARAYVGVAGVLGPDQADVIRAALPMRVLLVEDDRHAAVVGALAQADGIVAGIGTGSFLARRSGETVRFLGGWGARLGDEASGAWLGRAALARVLHVRDGLYPPSALTGALLLRFDNAHAEIVGFAARSSARELAELAPMVADAADAGDANATTLMQGGAAYIAQACAALDWAVGTPICLLGGLAPRYATYLPGDLAEHLQEPEGTALDGALALAKRVPM